MPCIDQACVPDREQQALSARILKQGGAGLGVEQQPL